VKKEFFINKYEAYRETSKILSFCLIIISICFLVSVYFIYSLNKNQKIVIIPPGADSRIEVSHNSIDINTLKLWSKYITGLFLTYTPSTYVDQANDLLKMAAPHFYKNLESLLLENRKDIETLKVSSTFFPDEFEVDRNKNELIIKGDRFLVVGSEILTKKREIYIISYEVINGRFNLTGIYQPKK